MIRFILAVMVFLGLLPLRVTAESAKSANKKGIEAYEKGEFDKSVEYFTDAIVLEPESEIIRYNRGTALSATGSATEALSELTRAAAASQDGHLAAGAYFNAGNTLLRESDLDGAIAQYRKALKLDQSSPDIRHNLELAIRLRDQKQQQRQQQQQQQPSDQQNPNENERQQDDQNQNEEQQDQNDNQSQQQGDQEESESAPSNRQLDTLMSIEEANRILDAIENEERQALSAKNQQMKSGINHGNDW